MKTEYKSLIDSKEFQQKILHLITTEELDKFFNHTVFSKKEDSGSYKSAMIHGMCIAAMLTSQCDPIFVKETVEENNI